MFNSKKIEELQKMINNVQDKQDWLFNHFTKRIDAIQDDSKKKFAWELRQEEISDIIDGKKFKKIRKILE